MRTLFNALVVLGLLSAPAFAGDKAAPAPAKTDSKDAKPADPKAPADAKKPTEAKPADPKAPADAKKPTEAKPTETKPAEKAPAKTK
jgi:hypothetical protein